MIRFDDAALDILRDAVKKRQSNKRFSHTCGVEKEAAYIGEIYLPEQVGALRAAALLHDLTKNIPDEEQISLCESLGVTLSDADMLTPPTLHGRSAEEIIKREFSQYATEEILRAVRLHTTGSADMTTFDKIIFLSDYIEAGRVYPDCRRMREKFHALCHDANPAVLDSTLAEVMMLTIQFLKDRNMPIAPATIEAYQALTGHGK